MNGVAQSQELIARLQRENQELRDAIAASQPPAVYQVTPVQRDQNDPQFFSKVNDVLHQNDLNLAQHYFGLAMVPSDLETKADLMQFLSRAACPAQLAGAICGLAADLEKISKDSVNMKIQNQEVEDRIVLEEEQLISALETKLVEKQRSIRDETIGMAVNAKNTLVNRNAGAVDRYLK